MKLGSLLGNDAIVASLDNLYFNEDKPSKLQPLDIAVITYLLLRRAADHELYDSQDTLAKRLCAERKAVARSITRLKRLEWISARKRGKGKTLALAVNLEKLPAAQPIRQAISQQAKCLAAQYQQIVAKLGRKRFPKGWLSQQFPSAQSLIDLCGGDVNQAWQIVAYGVLESKNHKKARISLYHFKTIYPRIAGQWQQKYGQTCQPAQIAPQMQPPLCTQPTAA